jgi:hypothetical protein
MTGRYARRDRISLEFGQRRVEFRFRRGTRSGALFGCQTGIVMLVAASPAAEPATRWRRRFGSHACHY